MAVTIELPADVQRRLEAEAARRGITLDQLVVEFARSIPEVKQRSPRRQLGFVGIGSSTSGRRARDADAMIAEGFGRD